MTVEV